ncbi:TPA: hypothetical protein ACUT80_003308 [Pseudomonas aeruginosa]|uniref:hypothetical protein n=1 Tax=unclassified Pseudomonas TaxID=196821 RepID=UPI0005B7C37A|nr:MULTISPECIES: hypothetical protein [unclassified Pseudomonas]HBO4785988.1 hypothetical protein [Pseudomonas aeruginosa]
MDNHASDASRLLYKALQINLSPANDAEYRELLARYRSNPVLKQVLAEVAEGMQLQVLDVSERGLIVAPTGKESRFSLRMSDLRKQPMSEEQKVATALCMLAISAVFYPTQELLDDESRFPIPARVPKFRDSLLVLAERMKEQDGDDNLVIEEMRPGWGYILQIAPMQPERPNSISSVDGLIRMVLRQMKESGLVTATRGEDDDDSRDFTPTHRLRINLRERTLPRLFDYIRAQVNA